MAMKGYYFSSMLYLCGLILCVLGRDGNDAGQGQQQGQMYIVYMGSSQSQERERGALVSSHVDLLSSVLGSRNEAEQSLVHSYTYAFAGFSAVLSAEQADALAEREGVLSVFPDAVLELHTTQSWDFLHVGLGMPGGFFSNPSSGQDVIIGLLDTGIWPEAASFSDEGFAPVPSRWKGACMQGKDFNVSNCNRKLIGARYYNKGIRNGASPNSNTARDDNGHGTHTASIAGGNIVANANYYRLANGTARGGFTGSRIAIYKVCTPRHGCESSQMLAAFDDAVNDGVDILSVSIGTRPSLKLDYFKDPIAIGAFHATQKGILVVSSAGNDGPDPQTVVNTAPWIFTVGATTINRQFRSNVILGNRNTIQGEAITFSNLSRSAIYPLVFAGNIPATNSTSRQDASTCEASALNASKVKGNIVLCLNDPSDYGRLFKKIDIQDMGGVGMILIDDKEKSVETNYGTFPSTTVSTKSGSQILSYINSTRTAVATITSTEVIKDYKPAPVVAFLTSRGPGQLTQNILKPDISAPGVNILAAWIPSRSDIPAGMKPSSFNLLTGTSMACPHVSGAAAFLKSKYPSWSPSAIRSALITTATSINNIGNPISNDNGRVATPFDMGVGQINPIGALQPGLVYETSNEDYFHFLCNYGLDSRRIKAISGNDSYRCPSDAKGALISNMNYPTIAIPALDASKGTATVSRTVTNVNLGEESIYKAKIEASGGLNVKVSPDTLHFIKSSNRLSLSYDVTFSGSAVATKGYAFGSVTWSDGKHNVRTTFAVNIV